MIVSRSAFVGRVNPKGSRAHRLSLAGYGWDGWDGCVVEWLGGMGGSVWCVVEWLGGMSGMGGMGVVCRWVDMLDVL